jgi:nitrate/nitrite transporter NarK
VWWVATADRPSEATWCSPEERQDIESRIASENAGKPPSAGYLAAVTDRTVVVLFVAYFFWMAGFYGFTMWVPSVVKSFAGAGASSARVGLLSAIPFVFAVVSMLVTSNLSDRTMKRQAFVAVPALVGAVGLVAGQFVHTPTLQLTCLVVAAIGVYGPYGPFWAVPSAILRPEVVGVSMGLINIANLGGFMGPYLVGYLRSTTGNDFAGFMVLAAFLVIVAVIFALIGADKRIATQAAARERAAASR